MKKLLLGLIVCCLLASLGVAGKPTLAILNIVDANQGITAQTNKLADLIFAEIATTDLLNLVERKEISKVIKEKELAASSYTKADQSIKLGKMLGANYILTGRIYPLDNKIVFNCKLINCQTGKIRGFSEFVDNHKSQDTQTTTFAAKAATYIKKIFDAKEKKK